MRHLGFERSWGGDLQNIWVKQRLTQQTARFLVRVKTGSKRFVVDQNLSIAVFFAATSPWTYVLDDIFSTTSHTTNLETRYGRKHQDHDYLQHFLLTKAAAISTLFDFSRGVADKLAARKTMTQMVDFCFSIWVPKIFKTIQNQTLSLLLDSKRSRFLLPNCSAVRFSDFRLIGKAFKFQIPVCSANMRHPFAPRSKLTCRRQVSQHPLRFNSSLVEIAK